ncbi:DUF4291 family protein [Streptomyces sioyaensis]|uniref:DUF4291 family protein n=1 Tax=Streptomyces sioyaensis TaxID=67364 RepID=UPI0037BDB2B1
MSYGRPARGAQRWDPERATDLSPLADRAIQAGLSGEAVDLNVDRWITELRDITPLVRRRPGLRC